MKTCWAFWSRKLLLLPPILLLDILLLPSPSSISYLLSICFPWLACQAFNRMQECMSHNENNSGARSLLKLSVLLKRVLLGVGLWRAFADVVFAKTWRDWMQWNQSAAIAWCFAFIRWQEFYLELWVLWRRRATVQKLPAWLRSEAWVNQRLQGDVKVGELDSCLYVEPGWQCRSMTQVYFSDLSFPFPQEKLPFEFFSYQW